MIGVVTVGFLIVPLADAQRRILAGVLSDELREDINRQAMAESLLVGWEGIKDERGQDIPYSVENAERLLREYPAFYDYIDQLATDEELFRQCDEPGTEEIGEEKENAGAGE